MKDKEPIVEITHLGKCFGNRRILSDINVDIYGGEIFGFLGPNGSGKTTTIKLMLGLLKIREGSIKICGHDVKTDFEAAVANAGGIIENPEMYKYLTGYQNLMQYARMYDDPPSKERIDELVKLVHLEGRINDKISKYSLGMRQRLGVAQALLGNPKLLVLDEPTNGLDPEGIKDLRNILKELAHKEGVAVFVSSHMLAELELMCDRVCVIDRGIVVGTRTLTEFGESFCEGDGEAQAEVYDETSGSGMEAAKISMQTFRIESDDNEKAVRILSDKGYRCIRENTSTENENSEHPSEFTLELPQGEIAEAIRTLVYGGVGIYKVVPVQKSLEDIFMEMTHRYVPGGDRQ